MRIVQVISGYFPHETAGTQVQMRDLSHALRAHGHQVEVFTRLGGREYAEFALSRGEWEGIPVTRITNNFDDVDRFERLYTHPIIDARFNDYLDEVRPDLVHIHHLTCLSTSMIEVARRRGTPVVMGLHDFWMICLRGQRIRPEDLGICETLDRTRCLTCLNRLWPHLLPLSGPRSLFERLLRRPPSFTKLRAWEYHVRRMLGACQALTAPSRFHRDRFIEWGIDPTRLYVAPYGLVAEDFASAHPPRPARNIGFIGSVIPSKGVHTLCDAFNRLNRSDLILHIHGETPSFHGDTGYVDRLRQLLNPQLDVRFHGRYEQRDVAGILAALDVLVVPSLWWESFCLTAREGALAGLPVVASRLGALEEAVDSGMAIGFRAADAGDLAQVLSRVLSDVGAHHTPSTAAILTLEASGNRMEQIYGAALGGRDVAPER